MLSFKEYINEGLTRKGSQFEYLENPSMKEMYKFFEKHVMQNMKDQDYTTEFRILVYQDTFYMWYAWNKTHAGFFNSVIQNIDKNAKYPYASEGLVVFPSTTKRYDKEVDTDLNSKIEGSKNYKDLLRAMKQISDLMGWRMNKKTASHIIISR